MDVFQTIRGKGILFYACARARIYSSTLILLLGTASASAAPNTFSQASADLTDPFRYIFNSE